MQVKVTHLDQVRFSIQSRTHTIVCDQPEENGGQDVGMTPPEFLLASLGSCAAYYAVQYLKTRNLLDTGNQTGVEVTVTAEKMKAPARLGQFDIQVTCPVPLTEAHRDGMLRSVHACLIHNTLLNPPQINIELALPALAVPQVG
jgi:uncharacterized OsmC-like protein